VWTRLSCGPFRIYRSVSINLCKIPNNQGHYINHEGYTGTYYTTGSPKLVSTALTVSNLSTVAVTSSPFFLISVIGSRACKILYRFFRTPITRLTWMRTRAICRDSSTSHFDSCCFPFVKAGITRRAPWRATSSSIRNPRSARIISPGSINFRKPLFLVSSWSDTLPPQHFDKKQITPVGVMPIRNLTVLCFL